MAKEKYTQEELKTAYNLAKQVYENAAFSEKGAVENLRNIIKDMPSRSAIHFIESFQKFMGGEGYSVYLSRKLIECYLENIINDYSTEQVAVFLKGLALNIEYIRETHPYKSMCALYNDYAGKIGFEKIYESAPLFTNADAKELSEIEGMADFSDLNEYEIAERIATTENGVPTSPLYSGKYIVRLHKENTRKPNTWGYRGYALLKYLEPISYENYKKLGIRSRDIKWDLENGLTKLFNSKEEVEAYCDNIKNPYKEVNINPRSTIDQGQMQASYEFAKRVYDGELAGKIAANILVDDYKMNRNTASINIQFLNDMLKPKTIKRSISISLLRYYADRVYEDYGKEKIEIFLKGLEYHIRYRHSQNNRVPGFCEFHNELSQRIGQVPIFDYSSPSNEIRKSSQVEGPSQIEVEAEDTSEPYSLEEIWKDKCFIEEERIKEIFECLQNKKNMILQGPPGTGKTWLAKKLGHALVGKKSNKQVMVVQFHPNMSYEDFVMGYRPSENSKLGISDGIFMKLIRKAYKKPDKDFVIIIEEINRGNPVQIFGEMLTLLEADKRNESEAMQLCYQDDFDPSIYIPENVYVIGTMNLADRSLAVVDFAFRRRFAFIDLEPKLNDLWLENTKEKLPDGQKDFADDMKKKIDELNEEIRNDLSLGKQFCIGHSFVTLSKDVKDPNIWFKEIVNTKIAPLLEEYWFSTFDDNDENKTKAEVAKEKLLAGL